MATDSEALAAGFLLPTGADYISDGDNAITQNAKAAMDYADALLKRPGQHAWDRISRATSEPVNVVVVGDSITEGTGASALVNRWQTKAQAIMRAALGITAGAQVPYVPGYYKTSAPQSLVTRAGDTLERTTNGLGWRTLEIRPGGSVTFTASATAAHLVVTKGSSSGVMAVKVNAATPVTYNTNSANGGGSHAYWWPVPISGAGVHTITVTVASGTLPVYVQGLMVRDGDEARGLRLLDAGYHGWAYSTATTAQLTTLAAAITAANPAVIVSALGTNDVAANNPDKLRTDVLAHVTSWHTAAPGVPVVLVWYPKATAHTDAQNRAARDVLVTIAAQDPLVSLLDLRRLLPDAGTTEGAALFPDGLHPNDAGHQRIATEVARLLLADNPDAITTQAALDVTRADVKAVADALPAKQDLIKSTGQRNVSHLLKGTDAGIATVWRWGPLVQVRLDGVRIPTPTGGIHEVLTLPAEWRPSHYAYTTTVQRWSSDVVAGARMHHITGNLELRNLTAGATVNLTLFYFASSAFPAEPYIGTPY